MLFYPAPGIGGHSIPVDPLYFSWKVRLTGYEAQFITPADQVNLAMPEHGVNLVASALSDRERALRGEAITKQASSVVDMRNAVKHFRGARASIVSL